MTTNVNPLLEDFKTQFHLPPFAAARPEHFPEALEIARARHLEEIECIVGNPEPPSFDNTIVALERAGKLLGRVARIFWNLTGAHTSDALQAVEREEAPKMAAHQSKITANAVLFGRVDTLFKQRELLGLTSEQRRLVEKTHLGFVRSGAALDSQGKARMAEIMQRLAELGTRFSQNVLADERAFVLPLPNEEDRAGLPNYLVDAAAAAARERGSEASHVVTLSRSLIEPFLTYSSRRDLREQAFRAWVSRGENHGLTDNRAIIAETLRLRAERARLLGYESFAAYKLDNSMAKTPEKVRELLETVWTPAKAKAEQERERLARRAREEGANIDIEAWDWRHYAEKVRAADYGIDEAEIKAYLPLDRIVDAAFATANRLFGLRFSEIKGLELYHPDVRAFEVIGADGHFMGLFLGDYFARASKRSGAWMSAYRGQSKLDEEERPIIVNVCNFAKAPEGKQTLLSFDDARTLFHEFGHALHGLMSDVTYPTLAGTSVVRDFVELPSQLYEHWLLTPEILGDFARHHETDEPMPKALIERISAARTFNQGFATVEYLASAIVDIDVHDAVPPLDPMAEEAATLERIGMPRSMVMRHRTPHFTHIYSGDGYASGYYSYLWSEVLDADAFLAFEEAGNVFDRQTAERLAKYVYSAGSSREEGEAYALFRGREPTVEGLLRKRGLAA